MAWRSAPWLPCDILWMVVGFPRALSGKLLALQDLKNRKTYLGKARLIIQ